MTAPLSLRLARLLVLTLRQHLYECAGGWWFVATLTIQAVLTPLIGLFVWSAVFPAEPYVVRYYVALLVVQLMTQAFEQHTFASKIYDGTISHELLKPQPVVIDPIGGNTAVRLWLTLMGLPLVIVAAAAFEVSFAWQNLLAALPALLLAAALTFVWNFCFSMTAFWTERVYAIVDFGAYATFLLGGAVAPLSFMPEPWRSVGEVLPFYAMLGFPAAVATGETSGGAIVAGLGVQLGWTILVVAAAIRLWRAGIRRYTVVGA